MKTMLLIPAGALLLAGLAGCSGSEPQEPMMVENTTENVVEQTPPPAPPEAENTAENVADNAANAVEVPPEAPIAADEQMMEDADATGMTARSQREDMATENTATPVE